MNYVIWFITIIHSAIGPCWEGLCRIMKSAGKDCAGRAKVFFLTRSDGHLFCASQTYAMGPGPCCSRFFFDNFRIFVILVAFYGKNHFNFYGLGIAPALITTLERLKFHIATPIQHKAIPLALEGKDIVGIAQTGTGKTMAFAIPTVQHLAQNKSRALVLVPTRELAVQVKESFAKIAQTFGIDSVALIGGDPIQKQLLALAKDPRIMIATPGRFIDLIERKKIRLHEVSILVLDEADRMFDMGFAPQIDRIIKTLPKVRQTMLFSATMPSAVMNIAATHMKIPCPSVAPRDGRRKSDPRNIHCPKRNAQRTFKEDSRAIARSVLIFAAQKLVLRGSRRR